MMVASPDLPPPRRWKNTGFEWISSPVIPRWEFSFRKLARCSERRSDESPGSLSPNTISAAGQLLLAQSADDDVNGPVNVHEFESVAKRKMNKLAYDFIAGGVEDELTLRANREAYTHVGLIPRVMVDVSTVDTSVELLGMKLDAPIVIAPSGGKNLVIPNAETVVARAAVAGKTLICTATGVEKLLTRRSP